MRAALPVMVAIKSIRASLVLLLICLAVAAGGAAAEPRVRV